MLLIRPKINVPIEVTDTVSGTKWKFIVQYDKSGHVNIAIDAPNNVVFHNTAKNRQKEERNGKQKQS